ncbi:kinase-like domain-containing protein [Xylogone sp. PMI_703]|nr:kinase-like domain-containing protein [Xylogone sp. PMI_703]
MDREYSKEYIIPICQKQKINDKAGSAMGTYLMEVQEQFVSDDLRKVSMRYENKADGFGYRYQFALKAFRRDNHDLFTNEVEAFEALKGHEGMVRYLGKYVHESRTLPGASGASDETFNILLEYGDLDLDEYLFERLPPVLSSEILHFWSDLFEVSNAIKGVHNLKYDKGGLPEEYYGWHADIKPDNILSVNGKFKLADPGFALFIKKTDGIPMGKVTGGAATYGAPECHSSRRTSSGAVHQTIDIWLGCVFSVAATWVALGYQGVLQYAEIRRNALKIYAKHQSSSLHPVTLDENNSVKCSTRSAAWHKYLRAILRKEDILTSLVLDLVDNKMLLSNPFERLSAEETYTELSRIYSETKEVQIKRGDKVPDLITKALLQLDDLAPAKALSMTQSEEPPINSHSRNAKSKRLEVPLMKTTHRSEVFKLDSRFGAGQQSPQPASNTPIDVTKPLYRPSQETDGTSPSLDETPVPQQISSTLNIPRVTSQNLYEAREQLKRFEKGLLGKASKLFGRQYKDDVLSRHLKNRDLLLKLVKLFLVDNAVSMVPHWSEATSLVETLVKKAAGQDPDGPDLQFTMGTHELKSEKRADAFKKAMKHKNAKPGKYVTDITVPLGKIFDEYLEKIIRSKSIPHRAEVKEMTVIVLTDGLWEGVKVKTDVDDLIVKFVQKLSELTNGFIRRQMSIEFIQFGKDPEATKRLKRLDNQLKKRGTQDIIDTEPSSGDVYKMLLGSSVDRYDRDESENDNLVESPAEVQESSPIFTAPSKYLGASYDGPYPSPPQTATENSSYIVAKANDGVKQHDGDIAVFLTATVLRSRTEGKTRS